MKKIYLWLGAGVGIIGICLLAAALIYFSQRARALNSRPLVLIQSPVYHEQVQVGEGIIVHATARADTGVSRIQLWANDILIADQQAPSGTRPAALVLSAGWEPPVEGSSTLVVWAVSADGVEGQASVEVVAVGDSPGSVATHVVQEGESLDTIAATFGVTPEEIAASSEAVNTESLQPGDEVTVPDTEDPGEAPGSSGWAGGEAEDSGTSGEASAPGAGAPDEAPDEPPDAGGTSPGSLDGLQFFLQAIPFLPPLDLVLEAIPFQPPADPVLLGVEVLALETRARYGALHCYVSLAGSEPRWVPDADANQSTDESFVSPDFGRSWEVAGFLAGGQAAVIPWPANQAVDFDISCVGIARGGMQAVKLGRVQGSVRPEAWGLIRHAVSAGAEGQFRIDYRVSQLDATGAAEKELDPDMAVPYNLRLDEERHLLLWDYSPGEAEAPVDGFAVLLNDTLQWTEAGSVRQSRLPAQWFNLPCGDEYRFTVVAYRQGYPAGTYSLTSDPALLSGGEQGGPGCGRSVVVTFDTLVTGDLGGSRSGVYGTFFANELQVGFDGRPIEGDSFPSELGLSNSSRYNVSQLTNAWGDGDARFVVDLPPGRAGISDLLLWVGFEIWDGGSKVCSGENTVSEDNLAGSYHGEIQTDRPVDGIPDRCRVTYSLEPVGEAPVVEPGAPPPLPDLRVENLSVDPSSGRLRVHIRNTGRAAWAEKDIVVRAVWPSGEEIGVYSWPNMTLEPGAVAVLSHGGLNPHPALGACVELDPDNAVEEERDRLAEAGILGANIRYCRPLPDLTVTGVEYDAEHEQVEITVENNGEITMHPSDTDGTLEGEDVRVEVLLAGADRPVTALYPDVTLGVRGTAVLVWTVDETVRDRMQSGYTVVLDPDNAIAEGDETNNEYVVPAAARLRLMWAGGWAHFCQTGTVEVYGENIGGRNTWNLELYASVHAGGSSRVVADWSTPEVEMDWRYSGDKVCTSEPFLTDWFEVAGDETLEIIRTAGLDIAAHGYRWFSGGGESLTIEDDFGGTTHIPAGLDARCLPQALRYYYDNGPGRSYGSCTYFPAMLAACGGIGEEGLHTAYYIDARSDDITGECWWSTSFLIYREDE